MSDSQAENCVIHIENYEILRRDDGRMMITFHEVEGHADWHREASLDARAKTLVLHSDAADVRLADFDVPFSELPDTILLAEIPQTDGEPVFGEVTARQVQTG